MDYKNVDDETQYKRKKTKATIAFNLDLRSGLDMPYDTVKRMDITYNSMKESKGKRIVGNPEPK